MTGPSWLAAVLAAVAIATSCYCAFRLAAGCRRPAREVDGDAVHAVMGVAMAGMLVPRLSVLPGGAWTAVFAVAAAWFAVRWFAAQGIAAPGIAARSFAARSFAAQGIAAQGIRGLRASTGKRRWRSAHPMPHLIESAGMIYMLVAVPAPAVGRGGQGAAMSGMAAHPALGGSLVALAVLLALVMVGYVLWTADQLTSLARAASAAARAAAGCRTGSSALGPMLGAWTKIVMGLTMGYMLLAML